MAFMARGGSPSFNFGGGGRGPNFNLRGDDDNNIDFNNNNNEYRRIYGNNFLHIYYYVPLDNTYVAMQIFATIIIVAVMAVAFLTTFKISIEDPIEKTKKWFLYLYLIAAGILLSMSFLASYFSKNKKMLINRLIIIVTITLATMLLFGLNKMYLDSNYNREKFEDIYVQKYGDNNSNKNERIDMSLSGFGVKTEKDYFIDQWIKSYKVFTFRAYAILLIDILLMLLLLFQIYKVAKIQVGLNKLEKDDVVVYDEEENVKF